MVGVILIQKAKYLVDDPEIVKALEIKDPPR
jgi:hypothetical protein